MRPIPIRLKRNPRRLYRVVLAALSAGAWSIVVVFFPPSTITIIVFHILLFASIFFLVSAVMNRRLHGVVAATGATLFFAVRAAGIADPIISALIAAATIALEIYIAKR